MYTFLFFISIFSILGACCFLGYLKIRKMYGEYDRKKTNEERIRDLKSMIEGAMSYIKKEYDTDFDDTVYKTLKIKTDFFLQAIEKKDQERQIYYLNRVYETLYETVYRLKTDFNNVNHILRPYKNLMEEIARDQIDFLRKFQ